MTEPTDMDCDEMPMDLTVRKRDEWPEEPWPGEEPEQQRDDGRSSSSSSSPPPPVPTNLVVPRPTPVIVPTAVAPAAPLDVQPVAPIPLDAAAARKPSPLTAVVPPHTADAGFAADSSSAATPLLFAASTPLPAPPQPQQQPPAHTAAQQLLRQQQMDLALQQHQLNLQQEQQLRFQQQLRQRQQQLQLAAYGGGSHRSLDFDSVVLRAAHEMAAAAAAAAAAAGPLYVAMPLSPASSESNPFPFAGTYGCTRRSTAIHAGSFGYNTCPYYGGTHGAGGQLSPESTTADDVQRRRRGVINLADLIGGGGGGHIVGINPGVDADDIADIYRTAEFQAFRQRYMDSLGPPRNYEKMRRSVPANKQRGNGGQPPAYDVSYAQKRMKNNEAAKKSRDAKRQKFLENQISVMYLTKKIREMNDLKRRLLISMT